MSSKVQTVGMKGSDVYSGSGNPLLDLSVLLVRGASQTSIEPLFLQALEEAEEDAFVLAFQTRDIRGGKGERALFQMLFATALTVKPHLALALLDLVPEYGCWRDVFSMHLPQVLELAAKQLLDDAKSEDKSISLCAKWAPREGKDTEGAKALAAILFPEEKRLSERLKRYRKLVAGLNKRIETTEIKMCDRKFAEIEPAKVPGLCLQKHMKAFLNESIKRSQVLRHPHDKDRMECREHFQEHFKKAAEGNAKINGSKTLYPHEVIKKLNALNSRAYQQAAPVQSVIEPSADERNALVAVWNGMVADAKALGGLGRTIAMCDFSGSMQSSNCGDTPYWVSMAMGLLISELTSDEFKDIFLTFDSDPQWQVLPKADIYTRMCSIGRVGQGLSTDFQKAMDLVLSTLKEKRVRPGQEPKDLIVITDMAWDKACSSDSNSFYTGHSYRHVVKTAPWQTHIQMIREAFKRAGEDMWGTPWTPPRIVIWNVAATCADFHATADTEGVIMLSGWSPSLFKVLTEEGARVQNPEEALRVILDSDRYNLVRERLASVAR
uniref:TROVE domain containing protein n=1 Tax=viral metagenome TaxID=1070528 RepID=A0A6C0BCT1_9ZZZZ